MDFEELVCYSQSVILLLLLIGYVINYSKKPATREKVNIGISCPSCGFLMTDKDVNFCSKCGNSISHSKGLSLQK